MFGSYGAVLYDPIRSATVELSIGSAAEGYDGECEEDGFFVLLTITGLEEDIVEMRLTRPEALTVAARIIELANQEETV